MKKRNLNTVLTAIVLTVSLSFFYACDDDNNNDFNVNQDNTTQLAELTEDSDKAALLFMLEEEKLARDTYTFLGDLWSINQFLNIKKSEQSHMDAIENLLIQYGLEYEILPAGQFADENLQAFYDQFVIDGSVSAANALQIGATIEDLDIVDLQDYIDVTTNASLVDVFGKLQCGSRNHLRNFLVGIENGGDTYTPQFLTEEEYNAIINGTNEKCGQN